MNIEIENVKYMVRRTAQRVVDEYEGWQDLDDLIDDECGRETCMMGDGLAILAKYGWFDAMMGQSDETPYELFRQDVTDMVHDLLEDEGIEYD